MKQLLKLTGCLAVAGLFASCQSAQQEADYQIIPMPQEIVTASGNPFILKSSVKILYPEGNENMQRNAKFLADYLKTATGKDFVIEAGTEGENAIVLALGTESENPESYQLKVTGDGITITAPTEAGVFYGIQSLRKSSLELKRDLEQVLERREQAMLFLNRRGYAGFVSCRACGHVMKCPHCDVSLSEHNGNRLICHYCGYETVKPEICPSCDSPHIGGFKAGTQQIEKVIEKEFPKARVLRMDFDTTRTKDSYEKILDSFAKHEADILVGTQMIVKGHDFPDVTLVGVIAADLSLNMDDYHCGERTFQLLTQAVGRSGRGNRPGQAVIQTYQPEHYSIQAAAIQDYEKFYKEEMGYRMLLDYPPAAHMMTVFGACQDEELLKNAMYYIEVFIRRVSPKEELHMIGPAAASVGKVKDVYRQVIHLKHRDISFLTAVREKLEKYIEINSGFRKIYIQFDMN